MRPVPGKEMRAKWWGRWQFMIVAATITVAAVTVITSAVDPDTGPAEAQCIPGSPIDGPAGCDPLIPGEDILDPVVDPVIDGIKDAAADLLAGTMDAMAGQMAAAAMASLDHLWTGITVTTEANLDSVDGMYELMRAAAGSVAGVLLILALFAAVGKRDNTEIVLTLLRGALVGAGIASTRPIMEVVVPGFDGLAGAIVFNANDEIGAWIEGIGGPLIAAVGVVMWPWLMFAAAAFSLGAIVVLMVHVGLMFMILGFYVMSPLFWVFIIHPMTRSIAVNAARKFMAVLMTKIAMAVGIGIVASVLAASGDTADPVEAVNRLVLGGVGFLALGFVPKAMWDLSGLDVGATIANAREIGQNLFRPAQVAATVAAAAATAGSSASFVASLAGPNAAKVANGLKGNGNNGGGSGSGGGGSPAGGPAGDGGYDGGGGGGGTVRHYHEVVNQPGPPRNPNPPNGNGDGDGGSEETVRHYHTKPDQGAVGGPVTETTGRSV